MAAGNYRAWVRAIAADSTPGSWSVGIDFTVADTAPASHLMDLDQLLAVRPLGFDADRNGQAESTAEYEQSEVELPIGPVAPTSQPGPIRPGTTVSDVDELPPNTIDDFLAAFAERAF